MRALQTPSINTSYPCVFLEQDPFQRLNCSNLKPPSLSSFWDKIPFFLPFICLLAEAADLGGQGHSPCRDVCAVAVGTSETCSFLVKMLGRSCHGAAVRWEAVPAPGLPPAVEFRWMPGYFWCHSGVAAGKRCPLFSSISPGTNVNKRKFFPLVFFDFRASASTFLWWELFGICRSWHLSPGSWLFVF